MARRWQISFPAGLMLITAIFGLLLTAGLYVRVSILRSGLEDYRKAPLCQEDTGCRQRIEVTPLDGELTYTFSAGGSGRRGSSPPIRRVTGYRLVVTLPDSTRHIITINFNDYAYGRTGDHSVNFPSSLDAPGFPVGSPRSPMSVEVWKGDVTILAVASIGDVATSKHPFLLYSKAQGDLIGAPIGIGMLLMITVSFMNVSAHRKRKR